eukprot:4336956-Pyramimonas_sp.AAC.1
MPGQPAAGGSQPARSRPRSSPQRKSCSPRTEASHLRGIELHGAQLPNMHPSWSVNTVRHRTPRQGRGAPCGPQRGAKPAEPPELHTAAAA